MNFDNFSKCIRICIIKTGLFVLIIYVYIRLKQNILQVKNINKRKELTNVNQ